MDVEISKHFPQHTFGLRYMNIRDRGEHAREYARRML